RAAGLTGRDVSDASAVGRPTRLRAFDEEAVARPVRVHDPDFIFKLVVHLVRPTARIDYLRAVGRDLRRVDVLPIEIGVYGQTVAPGGVGIKREREDNDGQGQGSNTTHVRISVQVVPGYRSRRDRAKLRACVFAGRD